MNKQLGFEMFAWVKNLFPVYRSLTGQGNRETLKFIKKIVPNLKIKEIPSGTVVGDWTIPNEWNIESASVSERDGKKIIDFKSNNLHVVGYSAPVNRVMTFKELDAHLYSLPDQPDAIPYVTSYYERRWGFCLPHSLRSILRKTPNKKYHVRINSKLHKGSLTFGELLLTGKSTKEILLSTYICHPGMANNELSGPVVATAISRALAARKYRRHSFRILFVPETIGSIAYIHRNLKMLKRNVIAGFVLTCMGDEKNVSYLSSRNGNSLADRVAKHVLHYLHPRHSEYSFLDRGSDERQYCSPGVDLPVCSIMRSKYGEYPEYHTSLDNLDFISPHGLLGSYHILMECIDVLENNRTFKNRYVCEPQLGKRGLYPTLSEKKRSKETEMMMNLLAYADGSKDLLEIAQKINVYAKELIPLCEKLERAKLVFQI